MGVLGIGLIMEEVGKGARLVFRYPASPPPSFIGYSNLGKKGSSSAHPESSSKNKSADLNSSSIADGSNDGGANGSIDLFFDLPARVISKLFRPKRPLCGQPLTLNVSGTTFCCRAELFDTQPSTIGGSEGSNHPLVLFSVIVALAPIASSAAEGTESSHVHHHHHHVESSNHPHSQSQRSDATFTTIKIIHRNLAKICRVLTREELRCRYVSRQCNMMLQIRKDYELRFSTSLSSGSDNNSATISGGGESSSSKKETANPSSLHPPLSPGKSKSAGGGHPPKAKDSKKAIAASASADDDDENINRLDLTREQRREYVQNLIELLLAASSPADGASHENDDMYGAGQQHGSLARELAQIFHLISSQASSPAPMSRVTGQDDGVVYINRHIAVPLDPVEIARQSFMQQPDRQKKLSCIRPYHTLLFPNSSPAEVLKSLMVNGVNEMITSPSITHSLRRILPHIHPRKSLTELVFDSGISLPHVMGAAAWLVHSRICVVAMPVLRKNRYACVEGVVPKMSKLALPFWQTFNSRSKDCTFYWGGDAGESSATTGLPHIFVVVSALSSTTNENGPSSASPMLGEAIDKLAGPGADELEFVEDMSPVYGPSENYHIPRPTSTNSLGRSQGAAKVPLHLNLPLPLGLGGSTGTTSGKFKSATEEISYSMAVWLVANNIVVDMKDFLVATHSSHKPRPDETKPSSSEEALCNELLHYGCLDGSWSIEALQYHFGLKDQQLEKLISYGKKANCICVVSRVACPTDDNGIP